MFPLMNLIITKWLLVYVLENKHNFYVIHFLSLTVYQTAERSFFVYGDPIVCHNAVLGCFS